MSSLPRVFLSSGNPVAVLGRCKQAAVKAGWSLAQWVEFSASVRACFTPEALPEEQEQMMAVVRSHFEVTTANDFTTDPTQWDHRERTA